MQKTWISLLIAVVLVLLGGILLMNRDAKRASVQSNNIPQDALMRTDAPTESMDHMPCHQMGNGEWMGQCEFDAQGHIKP